MTFSALYFGSSGWLVEFGDFHVLVDPWLTGKLSFPPGPWLIEGNLSYEIDIPKRVDLLLLTQGLADHSHPPTLNKLSRSLQVVGSPSAARVVRSLGFEKVDELHPGQMKEINELTIEATAGAKVPHIENGYLLSHPLGSLYLEPHGFLDKKIGFRQLDAVITPVVNLSLPLAGDFIRGRTVLPELINRFLPLTVLASTTGGDAIFTGLLGNLISTEGTTEDVAQSLGEGTRFIDPKLGLRYQLRTHLEKVP